MLQLLKSSKFFEQIIYESCYQAMIIILTGWWYSFLPSFHAISFPVPFSFSLVPLFLICEGIIPILWKLTIIFFSLGDFLTRNKMDIDWFTIRFDINIFQQIYFHFFDVTSCFVGIKLLFLFSFLVFSSLIMKHALEYKYSNRIT